MVLETIYKNEQALAKASKFHKFVYCRIARMLHIFLLNKLYAIGVHGSYG